MDREFMEEYYELKYQEGFMVKALEADQQCKELYHKVMELEGKVEAVMRREGKESRLLHGKLFAAKGDLEGLVLLLAYLQGAEDREKMLK